MSVYSLSKVFLFVWFCVNWYVSAKNYCTHVQKNCPIIAHFWIADLPDFRIPRKIFLRFRFEKTGHLSQKKKLHTSLLIINEVSKNYCTLVQKSCPIIAHFRIADLPDFRIPRKIFLGFRFWKNCPSFQKNNCSHFHC